MVFDNKIETKYDNLNNRNSFLEFTGNWFIDAGILGFVNLMEEVYKYDLNNIINYDFSKENFYKAYFLYYIKNVSTNWIRRQTLIKEVNEEIKENFNHRKKQIINYINNLNLECKSNSREKIREEILNLNTLIKEKIKESFSEFNRVLKKVFSNNKKIILQKLDEIGIIFNEPFFQNLNFANPGKNKKGNEKEVLRSFEDMIFEYKIKGELTEDAFDKTISKFIFSEKEFPNILYSKIQTIKDLDKIVGKNSIMYMLCFPIAFNKVFDKFIFFYSNDLRFCYYINKKIKIFIEKVKDKKINIFNITWKAIIDTLIEYKSEFSLENMYLIEYESIQQQELKNVKYLGIPKLQAQVLLDDHIRNALNQYIVIHKASKNTIKKWILEEFISGKPLYPLAFQHIKTCLTNDINVNYFVFYSSLLDAAILEFKEKQKERRTTTLFSNEFLKGSYREIVQEVKREFSIAYYYTTQEIPKYFGNYDERKRFTYLLLDALHSQSKTEFLYILLKKLNTEKIIHKPALNWIFGKIIKNNISWKEYALLLTGGLVL